MTVELSQRWLGVRPYVLVEVKAGGADDGDTLELSVEAGGGLAADGLGAAAELLYLAASELAGRSPEALAVALEWLNADVITDLGLTDHDTGS